MSFKTQSAYIIILKRLFPVMILLLAYNLLQADNNIAVFIDNKSIYDEDDFSFEEISIGETESHKMTIRNTGKHIITINNSESLTFENDKENEFSIDLENSYTIAPNEELNFNINYSPKVAGLKEVSLNISDSKDKNNPFTLLVYAILAQPTIYKLHQNYPNPFHSETKIRIDLLETSKVILEIYTQFGKKIKSLVDETLNEGSYQYTFNREGLKGGVYFCRFNVYSKVSDKSYSETIRMFIKK
jgi:hypothetical protein